MKKHMIVLFSVLIFILLFTASSSAQFLGYESLLSTYLAPADWQLEYFQPLEPGELEKGGYRISPLIVGVNYSNKRDYTSEESTSYDYDNTTTAYGVVFDTAFSDSFTLHGKYIYQPWEEYEGFGLGTDESRVSLLDLFMNYKIDDDKKLYFGYNRILSEDKDYNDDTLNYEDEDITNFYYLGFEMRGQFTGGND